MTPFWSNYLSIEESSSETLICVEGLEPPISCSQSRRVTKLRYTQ